VRRLGRYIYAGVTVLSLLVCLATVVIWVRSNWYLERACGGQDGRSWFIDVQSGTISLTTDRNEAGRTVFPQRSSERISSLPRPDLQLMAALARNRRQLYTWHLPGVEYNSYWSGGLESPVSHYREFTISFWPIILVTLILPASHVCLRRRKRPGHCPKCRYDLVLCVSAFDLLQIETRSRRSSQGVIYHILRFWGIG